MIRTNHSRLMTDDSRRTTHHLRLTTYDSQLTILATALLLAGCMAGNRETNLGRETISVPAVYSRYLTFPLPSHGIESEFNPPVLRWPVRKGEAVKYDVRLSMDSLFRSGVIAKAGSAWAMFNPHEKLSDGTWYWQHRLAEGEWSPVKKFRVTGTTHELVSPAPESFLKKIPNGHPRVLADRSVMSQLRDLPYSPDKQAILKEALAAMEGGVPAEEDGKAQRKTQNEEQNRKFRQDASKRLADFVYRTVVPLCQGYLLSGDDRFRERALDIAFAVAKWDPAGVTSSEISDFADARCMLAMAIALDTFYDHLSANQREILVNAVHVRADGFYRSWINNQEARVLSGHVWQHILHYFFQTALALYGEHPDAENWLGYAYELFLARAPILGGTDGGWAEGVSYFRMNMETLIEIPLFIGAYTGFDFIKSHPWYVENINWLIYNIPPGSSADGFGDNTEEVFTPGGEYVAFATELAKLTGNRRAAWYIRECGRYEQPDLSSIQTLRWIRLTRTCDLPMPEAQEHPAFPTGTVFRDIGVVSMQSTPENTTENLSVVMRSSPFGSYGHFLSDQNAFNILYGGKRTFFRTGYKVTMKDPHRTGWYQHTKSNNSILVDGEGQPYSTEAFGWIPEFLTGERLAYALADASNAYRSRETGEDCGVTKFYRHLVLLKPDIVFIYDELESEKAVSWSWLIHSMEKVTLNPDENSFESVFDHARGIGKLWSSHSVNWALADTFDVPAVNWRNSMDASGNLKTYDDGQWHLKAVSNGKNSAMRFLAVLQLGPDVTLSNISPEFQDGLVRVTVGDWTISARLDTAAEPLLMAEDQSGNSLVYQGDKNTTLRENIDGKEVRREAKQIIPWHVKQSRLHQQSVLD